MTFATVVTFVITSIKLNSQCKSRSHSWCTRTPVKVFAWFSPQTLSGLIVMIDPIILIIVMIIVTILIIIVIMMSTLSGLRRRRSSGGEVGRATMRFDSGPRITSVEGGHHQHQHCSHRHLGHSHRLHDRHRVHVRSGRGLINMSEFEASRRLEEAIQLEPGVEYSVRVVTRCICSR